MTENIPLPLSDLPLQHPGTVLALSAAPDTARHLASLGFTKGAKVIPVLVGPPGDPTAYYIKGSLIALRREMAATVTVTAAVEPEGVVEA